MALVQTLKKDGIFEWSIVNQDDKKKTEKKISIIVRKEDGLINATQVARACGKRIYDWLRTKETQQHITTFCKLNNKHPDEVVVIVKGGDAKKQGTYLHRS